MRELIGTGQECERGLETTRQEARGPRSLRVSEFSKTPRTSYFRRVRGSIHLEHYRLRTTGVEMIVAALFGRQLRLTLYSLTT
jgi:hypothetical protein